MRNRKIVDWVSFTINVEQDLSNGVTVLRSWDNFLDAFEKFSPEMYWYFVSNISQGWKPSRGRSPYSHSWSNSAGFVVFYSPKLPHALIEITGTGCDRLRKENFMNRVLHTVKHRVTRLDFAVDVECDTKPSEVVEDGINGRFKSKSNIISETGETQYVGSRKSDRYLRIYRYNEPHPRHKLMRYEFVFKKQLARDMLQSYVAGQFNDERMMAYCGHAFGIEHDTFSTTAEPIPTHIYRKERENAGTLRWIVSQCAPAFKKLVRQGVIENPESFIKEYFYE